MLDICSSKDVEVVKRIPLLEEGATRSFGLKAMKELSSGDVDELLLNDSFNGIWSHLKYLGFLVGKIDPMWFTFKNDCADLPRSRWNRIANNRERLNVLFHADPRSFALFAKGSRDEATAFSPRESVVTAFINNLDILARKSEKVEAKRDILVASLKTTSRTGDLYSLDDGFDPIRCLISDFIFDLSKDEQLKDDDVFEFQDAMARDLKEQQYVHHWNEGDVVFVSKLTFHQRVCKTVADVSKLENPLYRVSVYS